VGESKKKSRLQDREDVAMEEENCSSTSQECQEQEEVLIQSCDASSAKPGEGTVGERRLSKNKRLK